MAIEKGEMIFIRCDECKQLFGAECPTLPPEPGQPEGYLGEPGKIIYALGAYGHVLERHEYFQSHQPLMAIKALCPPCRAAAEERGKAVT